MTIALADDTDYELIRWSLYQGLKTLDFIEPGVGAFPLLDVMVFLTRGKLKMKGFADLFNKLDVVLLKLSASSYQSSRSCKIVSAIQELILVMPSSRERSRYLNELRGRWGYLLLADFEDPQYEDEISNHHSLQRESYE